MTTKPIVQLKPQAAVVELATSPPEYAIPYREAARRLGYRSSKSVQRLVAAGELRTIGRRIIVASIEAYLRRQQEGQAA